MGALAALVIARTDRAQGAGAGDRAAARQAARRPQQSRAFRGVRGDRRRPSRGGLAEAAGRARAAAAGHGLRDRVVGPSARLDRRQEAMGPLLRQLNLELRGGDRVLALNRWVELRDWAAPEMLDADLRWRLAEAQVAEGRESDARQVLDGFPPAAFAGRQLGVKTRLLKAAMACNSRLMLPLAEHLAAEPNLPETWRPAVAEAASRGRALQAERRALRRSRRSAWRPPRPRRGAGRAGGAGGAAAGGRSDPAAFPRGKSRGRRRRPPSGDRARAAGRGGGGADRRSREAVAADRPFLR